jgi:NAD(P)-dependent dehydrogenase (short-subunit alcohol dehydrogenase family)
MTRTDSSPVPDYRARLTLDGRGAVVLGCGQGIGRQVVHAVRQAGARVVCADRDADLVGEVAEEIGGGIPVVADVSRPQDVARVFVVAEAELGRVDAVVDVVGLVRWGPIDDITDKAWNLTLEVCLHQALHVLQSGVPVLERAGGGSMVFVGSVSGLYGAPNHAAYGAAKAGLMALAKSAAVEYGPRGVRVNSVAPGTVATPPVLARLTPERRAAQEASAPVGRIAEASDIASSILFFLTDLSRHVSGQTLIVDGGVSALFPHGL